MRKETVALDLFLDGKPYKKDVRMTITFHPLGGYSEEMSKVNVDEVYKTLDGMYDKSVVGQGAIFQKKWYIKRAELIPKQINWDNIPVMDTTNNPFTASAYNRPISLRQFYGRFNSYDYVAYNIISRRKAKGFQCAFCGGDDASIVHMRHDIESNVREPINAYCNRACFEQDQLDVI